MKKNQGYIKKSITFNESTLTDTSLLSNLSDDNIMITLLVIVLSTNLPTIKVCCNSETISCSCWIQTQNY